MPLRIPARNVGGDQIMESATNTNTREEQVMRLGGTFPIAATTGTINTSTGTVTATNVTNAGTAFIMVYGTHAGLNLTFEALNSSGGNTNWVQVAASRTDTGTLQTVTGVLPANLIAAWRLPVGRVDQVRVRATAYTSGTLNVIIDPSVPFGEPVVNSIMSNPPGATTASFTASNAAYTITTEALRSLTPQRNLTAAGAATTHTVPAGKTFRVLGFNASVRQGAVTSALAISFNLRAVLTGTVTNAGPVVANLGISVTNVVGATGSAGGAVGQFIELPSGTSFGVSDLSSATSAGTTVWVSLYGIEF
jgi:hypothetical protein